MKFLHLSDIHLGKRVNEYSMLDEQKYILDNIIDIAENEKVEAIIIAGDVYDRNMPPAEAVTLLNDFITKLYDDKISTFIIGGNHDSAERLSFGSKIMNMGGIYISNAFKGDITPYTLSDEFGNINIYLLPFIKPININSVYTDANVETYTDAVKYAINRMNVDTSQRNILAAHQFVTGASLSGSEVSAVGGIDNVDSSVFSVFDYTALGHIHSAQNIGEENIRYCGTPLKYSLSEINSKKSVSVVEIKEKGSLSINKIPLIPLHDMREIKGKYSELVDRRNYADTNTDDYIYITLTDENYIPDVADRLRTIYPNLMNVRYDNKHSDNDNILLSNQYIENKSPFEIFEDLYRLQNNTELNEYQKNYLKSEIKKIWEEQDQ